MAKNIYYILTTETWMQNFERYEDALAEYNRLRRTHEHLRLERANAETGTARVVRQKNNIW